MKNSPEFKYRYDEQDGVFIRDTEISVNWVVSQILGKKCQITKIDNNDLQKFLLMLSESDMRMPDGKYVLFWLKDKLKEKKDLVEGKRSEAAFNTTERYKFILEQIDFFLIGIKNLKEKMEIKIEKKKKKQPNRMKAHFEPKEES